MSNPNLFGTPRGKTEFERRIESVVSPAQFIIKLAAEEIKEYKKDGKHVRYTPRERKNLIRKCCHEILGLMDTIDAKELMP